MARCVLGIALVFLIASTLSAQTAITYTPQMPIHGVGHDYIGMLDETVNPADGNVNISINFPVPQGRGLTIPFSVVYSSSTLGAMNGHANADFLTANGWSYTFPILSYVQGKIQIGTVNEADGNNEPQYCYYTSNYVFHAPGTGGQHQLVLSQTYPYGVPSNGASCSTVPELVGGDYEYLASLPNNSCEGGPCVTQGATVADADGTIYYFSGALDWVGGAQGELLAMPTYVEDRNGNRATIQNNYGGFSNYSGGSASIVDDAGRTVLSTSGFGQTGNTISVSGISKSYTLTWGTSSQEILIPVEQYGQAYVGGLGPCPQVGQNGWGAQPSLGPGITGITLPNEDSYTFSYDPTYGLLTQITYPTGGYVKYTWGLNQNSSSFVKTVSEDGENYYCVSTVDQPAVVERQVSYDGKTVALTQNFQYSTKWQSPQVGWIQSETTTVTTTDNVTGLTYATVYTYSSTSSGTPPNDPAVQPNGWQLQYPSEEQTVQYFKDTNVSGTPLKTATKGWYDPEHLICEIDTLDNGQLSGVFNAYGSGGSGGPGFIPLLVQKNEYDFGQLSSASSCSNGASIPSNIVPTRETATTYHPFGAQPLYLQPVSTMTALTLADRPASVITYGNVNGTLTEVAATNYSYDQTGVGSVSATGHDETNYSSSSTAPRGNATTTAVQCLQACQSQTITYAYNELGQVTSATDPCGNATCGDVVGTNHTTTFSYTDSYTSGTPSGNTNAYLTTITNPLGQSRSFSYAYGSGELTVSKDENLQPTSYAYNDPFVRPTQVSYPDGGETTYSYNDSPYSSTTPSPSVTTTKVITSSLNAMNVGAADGMGHPVETEFYDPDGLDYTFITYDGLGRRHSVTNPYRSTSDSTYGTATYAYDALGRVKLVTQTDGSRVQTSYCGPSTLVTDESGHWRRSTTDGLGRLVEVDEPNSATATVSACPQSGDPIVATTYSYDALNNLTGVTQGGSRQRTFAYDSLSRPLASCNPESCSGTGTITLPGGNATGSITISWSGGSSGDKLLVYINGTGDGNLCVVFFEGGESASAVATGTASALNNDSICSQYVTAVANGGVVNLTANVTGPSGDYPFSASTNGTSYTVTTSGPDLVQGEGQTVPGGSTLYTYDANGNLTSKTGPAQNQTGSSTVTLSYCYDALNRTTSKAYTAQSCPMTTPVATYTYDQTACLGQTSCYDVGRRTSMTDSAGSESWSYDKMGRVLTDQRTTNGITKSAIYTYAPYVDGSLSTLQYPSGRTISYNTGSAERLLSASDTANSIYYATGAHYAPQGALSSLTNNDNVFSTQIYNTRLQPCWIYVTTGTALATSTACTGTDSTPGNLLDLEYNFSLGSADNGNVVGITNNRDITRNQVFTYDWLNRIATAETTSTDSTSSAHCWSQVFGYDVWANLLNIQAGSTAYNGCTQPSALSLTVTSQNQISGYTYDAAGNLNTIPGAGGASYTYDAENHLTVTSGVTYVYDGDGKRVEKSGSKLYWYGADGEVLDETDQTGSTTNSAFNEYIYFSGQRIARRDSSGDVYYYFADHLGTSRTMAQVLSGQTTATLCYDGDFYPFGGERAYTSTCPQNYKFTGKERDTESSLDYFGARYYASSMGRFMSTDPAFESEILELPQTWNRYSYVYNRPLFATDPDGRCPPCVGAIIGGVVEGGWNLGSQLYNNGGSLGDVNWRDVGANALGGAVTGAIAGATGGTSLLAEAAVGAGANAAGGIVTRIAEGEGPDEAFDAGDIAGDAVSGFVGGAAGHLASEFVHPPEGEMGPRPKGRRHAAKYDAELKRRNRAALRTLGIGAAALPPAAHLTQSGIGAAWGWLTGLFQSSSEPEGKVTVTVTNCVTDENGKRSCTTTTQ